MEEEDHIQPLLTFSQERDLKEHLLNTLGIHPDDLQLQSLMYSQEANNSEVQNPQLDNILENQEVSNCNSKTRDHQLQAILNNKEMNNYNSDTQDVSNEDTLDSHKVNGYNSEMQNFNYGSKTEDHHFILNNEEVNNYSSDTQDIQDRDTINNQEVNDFNTEMQNFQAEGVFSNKKVQMTNGYDCDMQYPPPLTAPVICNEDYPGNNSFRVIISPNNSILKNNKWVYSPKLDKVFADMNVDFPVDFHWIPAHTKLFVRATPLFSLSQHAQEPVSRCIAHVQKSDNSNRGLEEHIWKHVLRCNYPGAVYQGNLENGEHLSVVVPLSEPQSGTDTTRYMYQFVCKNSCPQGMNRRSIEVVFTLEDCSGFILGRKKISVRICSSPKRDKEKEERDLSNERGSDSESFNCKKRKKIKKTHENVDLKVHEITVPVVGSHNAQELFKFAFNLMAGDQLRSGIKEPYQKVMNDIIIRQGKLTE